MSIYKGVAAGVAGGLVGSFAMNQFQALWGKLMENEERSHGAQSLQQGSPEHGLGHELAKRGVDEADDNAAVRTGNAVSELVPAAGLSRKPSEYPASIHTYAFASHLVYGLTTEIVRRAVRKAL
jgi:hypothetical protein